MKIEGEARISAAREVHAALAGDRSALAVVGLEGLNHHGLLREIEGHDHVASRRPVRASSKAAF